MKLDITVFKLRMQQTLDKLPAVDKAFVMGAVAYAEATGAKVAPKELVALLKELEK